MMALAVQYAGHGCQAGTCCIKIKLHFRVSIACPTDNPAEGAMHQSDYQSPARDNQAVSDLLGFL